MNLVRKLVYGRSIIVVSGLPRSGTSMAMRMLKAGGIATLEDGRREADTDNPKGYFELQRVMDLANDPDKSWLKEARGKAVKIISYLLKELPASNNYKVVLMERDIREVLASQTKMLTRRSTEDQVEDEKMAANYESLIWRVNYLLEHASHMDALRLPYSEVVAKPRFQAERLREFLGADLDVESMTAAVDPSLYRNRAV